MEFSDAIASISTRPLKKIMQAIVDFAAPTLTHGSHSTTISSILALSGKNCISENLPYLGSEGDVILLKTSPDKTSFGFCIELNKFFLSNEMEDNLITFIEMFPIGSSIQFLKIESKNSAIDFCNEYEQQINDTEKNSPSLQSRLNELRNALTDIDPQNSIKNETRYMSFSFTFDINLRTEKDLYDLRLAINEAVESIREFFLKNKIEFKILDKNALRSLILRLIAPQVTKKDREYFLENTKNFDLANGFSNEDFSFSLFSTGEIALHTASKERVVCCKVLSSNARRENFISEIDDRDNLDEISLDDLHSSNLQIKETVHHFNNSPLFSYNFNSDFIYFGNYSVTEKGLQGFSGVMLQGDYETTVSESDRLIDKSLFFDISNEEEPFIAAAIMFLSMPMAYNTESDMTKRSGDSSPSKAVLMSGFSQPMSCVPLGSTTKAPFILRRNNGVIIPVGNEFIFSDTDTALITGHSSESRSIFISDYLQSAEKDNPPFIWSDNYHYEGYATLNDREIIEISDFNLPQYDFDFCRHITKTTNPELIYQLTTKFFADNQEISPEHEGQLYMHIRDICALLMKNNEVITLRKIYNLLPEKNDEIAINSYKSVKTLFDGDAGILFDERKPPITIDDKVFIGNSSLSGLIKISLLNSLISIAFINNKKTKRIALIEDSSTTNKEQFDYFTFLSAAKEHNLNVLISTDPLDEINNKSLISYIASNKTKIIACAQSRSSIKELRHIIGNNNQIDKMGYVSGNLFIENNSGKFDFYIFNTNSNKDEWIRFNYLSYKPSEWSQLVYSSNLRFVNFRMKFISENNSGLSSMKKAYDTMINN